MGGVLTQRRKGAEKQRACPMVRLGDVCEEIRERVNVAEIKREYYVTTDNMVKNCGGVCIAESIPSEGSLVAYQKGDILLSNIRPYLKKIWLADWAGGCSSDVIVFRISCTGIMREYLYQALSQDGFFEYSMQNVSGTKMPRGKRDWIKNFSFPLPPLSVQKEIVARLERELGECEKLGEKFGKIAELAEAEFKAELDEVFGTLEGMCGGVGEGEECFNAEAQRRRGAEVRRVRLGELGTMTRGRGIKRTETSSEGKPCIRYGEIYTSFNFILDKPKSYVPTDIYENSIRVKHGDLVFTLTGENAEEIAKTLAYLGKEEIAAGGDLAVWSNHGCNPKYLAYIMYSSALIKEKAIASNGQIIVHVSVKKIQQIQIPLPSPSVQKEIVERLDAAKARSEKLKAAAEHGLRAAVNLRKAILAEAFE